MANRPRLAAIITEYRKHSHGQHIVDRLTEGYGWNGDHYHPPMDVVALYVDQRPQGDLTEDRIKRFPQMKLYPTIAEALTGGTSKLAVDGVVVVGEHGTYKRTEKGQTQYPRYEFFQQVVKVYKDSGRSVPMFNDKHLSWNWDWAKEMYDTSKKMGFAYMAGSSLPVTWRTPVARTAARLARPRDHVRGLRRHRQLRLPRSGNRPVHDRTPARRRGRSEVAPGLSRRQLLQGPGRRRLFEGPDVRLPLPQPHPHPRRAKASTTSCPPSTT